MAKGKVINYRSGFPAQISIVINTTYDLFSDPQFTLINGEHPKLFQELLVKTGFHRMRAGAPFIYLRIVIVFQFVFGDVIIPLLNILTNIYGVIIFFRSIGLFKFFSVLFLLGELIIHLIKLIMAVLALFQSRILFQFFLDALFEVGSRHLQQFHELNLLGRELLE